MAQRKSLNEAKRDIESVCITDAPRREREEELQYSEEVMSIGEIVEGICFYYALPIPTISEMLPAEARRSASVAKTICMGRLCAISTP